MACVAETEFVEAGLNRVLTQYRESPKLLHMIRTYVRQAWAASTAACDMQQHFDLFTATGDQLTIIGRIMGFPRCHCVCAVQPVFGFDCGPDIPGRPVVGFCEGGTWLSCGEDGVSEICIDDDEVYRSLLIARSYQMQARYSWDDLTAALQAIFGSTARILDAGNGQVVLAPFRELTQLENALLQVIPRVLPVAPGISTRWHFGTFKVFGFGEGWGGFCEPVGDGDGQLIVTENGDSLGTETDSEFVTGVATRHSDWLCRSDVKPYSC